MKLIQGIFLNLLFAFFILIEYIKAQLSELPLGIELRHIADLQRFFRIDITDSQNHHNLIFHVSPLDNYENWSDPDVYISKTNHYPSAYNNDYSSSRVGDDILIISTQELKNISEIYAGVTCGKKCEFKVKAYYEDKEIIISKNQEMYFAFNNETAETKEVILKFYPEKDKYYEVYTFSPKLIDYEFTVSLHFQSSQTNVFLPNPWIGGKSVILEPKFIENEIRSCKNCHYRIVISGSSNLEVLVGVKETFITEDLILNKFYMSLLLPDKYNCYYFNKTLFTNEELEKNTDKIIVNANSYLQDVGLVILDNWKNLAKDLNDGRLEFNFKDEVIVKLNFTQIVNKYLCMESYLKKFTSYNLIVYRQSDSEYLQRMNFLINGLSKSGYLPAGKVTSYSLFDNSLNSTSLSLNLIVKDGNPVLHAYACLNKNDCFFTSENFEHFRPNLITTTKINDHYTISIPREDNICKKLKDENHQSYRTCSIMPIVKCEGDVECSFLISMQNSDGVFLLKYRIKNTKFINKDEYDYYKISNNDRYSNKLSIILHSHIGDADLYVSRTHKNPLDDPNVISSTTTLGNRDHIDIYDSNYDFNSHNYNSSLVGDYYIAVRGSQDSFYSIIYDTSLDQNPTQVFNYIEPGQIHSEVTIPEETKIFNVPNPSRPLKNGFIITALSLNCVGNLTVTKYDSKPTDKDYTVLSSPVNPKTAHNQIFITPDSPIYESNLYNIKYQLHSEKEDNTNNHNNFKATSCLFFISANTVGSELLLNEGIPHIYTLNTEQNLNEFFYVYSHISKNKNPCLIDIYFENRFVTLEVIIRFQPNESNSNNQNREVLTYKLISPENIIIKSSTFEKNCGNTYSCNILIQVKFKKNPLDNNPNNNLLTYKITARSNSLIPSYLKRGEIKMDSVIPNNYQYYFSEVNKNEVGEIILNSKVGSGVLVAKIIKKNAPKEPNADFNNIVLPTILNSSLRYNRQSNSIIFTKEDTKNCDECCEIYFGVYSENKENFKDNINQYSILFTTGNVNLKFNEHYSGTIDITNFESLIANPSAKIQYFTLIAEENQYSRISVSLMFDSNFKGKLLINVGELNDKVPFPTLDKNSFFISEEESQNSKFEFNLNKKSKKFIIGVYVDILKYSNSTSNVDYQIYAADISYINSKNFFEIKLGDNFQCSTYYQNQYCDFLMILPDTDTLIFYTQFTKEIFSNYVDHFMESTILANIYNATDYQNLVENEASRPRMGKNPMFISGVANEATQEYSLLPDNNLLIFKNPLKKIAVDNKNFNYNQTILCISVYLQRPSSFRLLSNRIHVSSSILSLRNNHYYLFMVTNADTLQLKSLDMNLRNLQRTDSDLYIISVDTILGEGTVNFDNKFYLMNPQTKNLKIVLNKANSNEIKINSFNHKDTKIAVPYICIVYFKFSLYKTELVLGEAYDILFPSLMYPKEFYFMALNNTYSNIANDIDITFNFQILEYKNQRPSMTLDKKDKFKLQNYYKEYNSSIRIDNNFSYNLGEYDPVHKVGMITTKLEKDKSYIINYSIYLESEKPEEELKLPSHFNYANDYLLMRVVFSSDNFKYTKASLPYKTYYYSSINSEQIADNSKKGNKIYHIHRLTRKNKNDNFFYIELASCGNEFSYSLREYNIFNDVKDEDFFVNKTSLKHEYKTHYGKKLIEVELNDSTKDLLLIVFPLKTFNKYLCQEINKLKVCETSYYSDYVVRYRTSKTRIDIEKYIIDKEGLVTLKINNNNDNPTEFNISWGSVLEKNEKYEYEAVAESKMFIRFYDAKKVEASELNSICHFDNSNALVDHIEIDNFHRNQDSYNYKFSKTVDYHISIMAETLKDNTYLTYIPTYIYIKIGGFSVILIVSLVFLIILLLFIMFLIYRKYRLTKKRLDYEINDVRNMANIPREASINSEIKMINMATTSSNGEKKYMNLSESNN